MDAANNVVSHGNNQFVTHTTFVRDATCRLPVVECCSYLVGIVVSSTGDSEVTAVIYIALDNGGIN